MMTSRASQNSNQQESDLTHRLDFILSSVALYRNLSNFKFVHLSEILARTVRFFIPSSSATCPKFFSEISPK